ncbi:hypothetical protein HJG60_009286 [Phyllostomus discolor]|uniref:Uncharacterized protein n=1 Tax=Phyllostomus discolor TaxID=89673 RepID=A0A833YPU8_9CHIR|nr:hypothetical protein HJG60_009286 [Phyllostomus discolor]
MRLKSPAADMGRTSPGRRVPLGESLGPAHLPPRSCLLGQGSCHLTTGDHPRPLHKPVPLPAGPFLPPAFCPNPAFLRTWHLSRLEGGNIFFAPRQGKADGRSHLSAAPGQAGTWGRRSEECGEGCHPIPTLLALSLPASPSPGRLSPVCI